MLFSCKLPLPRSVFDGKDYRLGTQRASIILRRMRPVACLCVYTAAVFFLGALIAPELYWLTQSAARHADFLARLAQNPFHRYVDRALLGLALIGLWPLLKCMGIRSWRDAGVVKPAGNWGKLGMGALAGFGSLALVALLALAAGARRLEADYTTAQFLSAFGKAAGAAIIVAVLEELLFRGAIFGSLKRVHHWITALIVSSGVYAIVHFFRKAPEPAQIGWASGFDMLWRMLHGFADLHALVPGFFALFVAGMILGLAYQRTQNLYFSIGLHAGWIFWLKFYGFLTASQPGANLWFWGSRRLIDGWLSFIVLAILLVVLWVFPWRQSDAR